MAAVTTLVSSATSSDRGVLSHPSSPTQLVTRTHIPLAHRRMLPLLLLLLLLTYTRQP
jgi:hypothetical protein